MPKILLIHGPNLNLLGLREPHLYGHETLEALNTKLLSSAKDLHVSLDIYQSNSESALINIIQNAHHDLMIINPAALTHTSIALRDAVAAIGIPFIEVHLTNIYAREPFRRHSYFSDLAIAVITGCGTRSYEYALTSAHEILLQRHKRGVTDSHGYSQS
jgi:3-dehydroquinate dehydratase II